MNAEAELAPAGSSGVQSFVGVMIMDAKSMKLPPNILVLGMSPLASPSQSSRPLVTRAILESLAFAVKANTQQVLDVSGQVPTSMGVCGGLANSRLYLELLANTLHLPVRVPKIKEGTAVGAAICAGVGGNVFHSFDEGVDALVHIESVVQPDEKLSKQYANFYRRWSKTLEPLMALSSRM
jgi:autoinducer 2 (AI-2) kinase